MDGQEAVDTVRAAHEFGSTFKLILTDINMPHKDGIEATREISEIYANSSSRPTIIGLTGHCDEHFISLAKAAGMKQVEPKPMYKSRL